MAGGVVVAGEAGEAGTGTDVGSVRGEELWPEVVSELGTEAATWVEADVEAAVGRGEVTSGAGGAWTGAETGVDT